VRKTINLPFSRSLLAGLSVVASLFAAAPAHALETTSSTGYAVGIYTSEWANGSAEGSGTVLDGTITRWASFDSTFNDNVASYSVCNNLGYSGTFTATVYQDSSYGNPIQSDTLTIDDGECVVVNVTTLNAASSLWVVPPNAHS
jgi:hypothetical protein